MSDAQLQIKNCPKQRECVAYDNLIDRLGELFDRVNFQCYHYDPFKDECKSDIKEVEKRGSAR